MNTEQKAREWLDAYRYFQASENEDKAFGIITALLAEREAFEARIAELQKPYVPMTDAERTEMMAVWHENSDLPPMIQYIETETIARYNEQRGVK